jgi:hypothetical protein
MKESRREEVDVKEKRAEMLKEKEKAIAERKNDSKESWF